MTSFNFNNTIQINNFLGPVNVNNQNNTFLGGYDYQFSCMPCEDYSSNIDLIFNGCDSSYSGDSFLKELGDWFHSTFNSIMNPQPSYVDQSNQSQCGMFEEFMNQMMTMIMAMFNQPTPQNVIPNENLICDVVPPTTVYDDPTNYVPSDPADVNPQPIPADNTPVNEPPVTVNLEYGDTDYAIQYDDGRFTAQVGGVDLELTLTDDGHAQTVYNDTLYDLGKVSEDGDGTFSIDESTATAPVASVVADYKLNYDGHDYEVTQHNNGTFTAKIGDNEEIPLGVNDQGQIVATYEGSNIVLGDLQDDGDGTYSIDKTAVAQ